MTRYEEGSKLARVIYVHRISDRRFSGIASRNFKIFRELCGEMSLKNDIGEAREGGWLPPSPNRPSIKALG